MEVFTLPAFAIARPLDQQTRGHVGGIVIAEVFGRLWTYSTYVFKLMKEIFGLLNATDACVFMLF
jgi:hypothetical protein